MSRLLLFTLLPALFAITEQLEAIKSLDVPEPVMDFILGCERSLRGGPKLPVAKMEFDPISGEPFEQINLMDVNKLRDSLGTSFDSEELVNLVFSHIQKSLSPQEAFNQRSHRCMEVKVDAPPQDQGALKYLLHEVVSNNNYVILEGLNRIFEHQIRRLYTKIETLILVPEGNSSETVEFTSKLRADDFALDITQFIPTLTKPTIVEAPPKPSIIKKAKEELIVKESTKINESPAGIRRRPNYNRPRNPVRIRTRADAVDPRDDIAVDVEEEEQIPRERPNRFATRRRLRIPFRSNADN